MPSSPRSRTRPCSRASARARCRSRHLKKVYGRSAMTEVMQDAINNSVNETLAERAERAATQPKIDLTEDQAEINRVLEGKADLAFDVSYEVLPPVELMDFKTVTYNRPHGRDRRQPTSRPRCSGCSATTAATRTRARTPWSPTATGSASRSSARSMAKTFEGGSSDHAHVTVGSGEFIPGFEEQLIGMKKGETARSTVTFPADYQQENLPGKTAKFDVTVLHVDGPKAGELDDDFAKTLGLENVDGAARGGEGADAHRTRFDEPPAHQAADPRCARCRPQVRRAAAAGRCRVRADLGPRQARDRGARPLLRGRGHDRGRGPRAVPQDRRAARAARAGGRRGRQRRTRSR